MHLRSEAGRKMHTDSGRQRREAIRSGPAPLGRDTEKNGGYGGYMAWEIIPGEETVRITFWALLTWGPKLGRQDSKSVGPTVGLFETDNATEERAHACWLPKQEGGGRLKLPRALAGFLGVPGRVTLPHPAPSPAPPAPALHPPGARVSGLGRAGTHTLRGNRAAYKPALGVSAPAAWDSPPCPNAVMLATVQRSPSSGLALALAPPPPTKLMTASTAREKTGLMLPSDSALPLGTHVKQIGTVLHKH